MVPAARSLVKITVIGLATAVATAAPTRTGHAHERRTAYLGPKLTSPTLVCKASQLAAAGFWRNPQNGAVEEAARIEEEPKPTFWRIAISAAKGTAQVIRFNANSEALEGPVVFSVEVTPGAGLLLVKAEREPGTSPEAISIDPANSSFVYSSQHANVLYNRANIWYGSCKPYE